MDGRRWIGAIVVLAIAFGGPLHLWLSHGEGHVVWPETELVVVHDDHHGHGGHCHQHRDHHAHHGELSTCESGDDHSGPCQDPVEECDLCLAVSFSAPFLSATIEIPQATTASEPATSFVGTTRDVWGPATATRRGPPRRA